MKSKLLFAEQTLRYVYDVSFWGILVYAIQVAVIRETPSPYVMFYVAGVFLCSYLIRNLAPNNIIMTAAHFLCAVPLIWMPGPQWIRITSGLILCVYLFPISSAFVKRGCQPAPLSEPWPSMLAVVLLYIAGTVAHQETFANLAYGAAMIMMGDYLCIRYAQGLHRYTEQVADVSGLPIRTVVSVNSKIVAGLMICMLALMTVCRFLKLDFLVQWIASVLFWLIEILFTGIMIVYIFFLTLLMKGGAAASDLNIQEELNNYTASYETSHAAELVVEAFAVILLLFICYKAIAAIVHFLARPRAAHDLEETKAETAHPMLERQKLEMANLSLRKSEIDRVRALYRKMVLRYKEMVPLTPQRTCGDIQQDIREQGGEAIDEATDLYESIRYGRTAAGRDQIKEMARLAKRERKR